MAPESELSHRILTFLPTACHTSSQSLSMQGRTISWHSSWHMCGSAASVAPPVTILLVFFLSKKRPSPCKVASQERRIVVMCLQNFVNVNRQQHLYIYINEHINPILNRFTKQTYPFARTIVQMETTSGLFGSYFAPFPPCAQQIPFKKKRARTLAGAGVSTSCSKGRPGCSRHLHPQNLRVTPYKTSSTLSSKRIGEAQSRLPR